MSGFFAPRREAMARLLGMLLLGSFIVLQVSAGVASAQSNGSLPDYYENRSQPIDNESWMDGNENVSGPSLLTYASRVSTFVIGGYGGSSGGSSGPLLMGMVLLGSTLSLGLQARVGVIGGGVLAFIAFWGVVAAGLAPQWLLPVFFMGASLLVASALRGVLR